MLLGGGGELMYMKNLKCMLNHEIFNVTDYNEKCWNLVVDQKQQHKLL